MIVSTVSNSDIYALNVFRGKNARVFSGGLQRLNIIKHTLSITEKRLLYVSWTRVTNTVVTDMWIRSSASDLIKTQEEIVAKRQCTMPLTAETSHPQGHSQK